MKIRIISILIIYILFSCNSRKNSEIHYISFSKITAIPIECENLRNNSDYKKQLSYKEANKLYHLMSNLQPAGDEYSADARAYGIIYNHNGSAKHFCMGNNIIEIDNKKYFVNEKLREYMLELTKLQIVYPKIKKGDKSPPSPPIIR